MSVTLKNTPNKITPVYNPVVFTSLSTNIGLSGFSYVYDLYSANTTTRLGSRITVPADPNGFGVINISRVLSSYVGYDFSPTMERINNPLNSYVNYDVKIGEQYIYLWPFYDTLDAGSFYPTYAGNTLVTGYTNTPHTFTTGDTVYITQTTGTTGSIGPYNDNVYTVIYVPNANSFVIQTNGFQGSPNGSTGTTVYSDYRKTTFPNLLGTSAYTAHNAAIPTYKFPVYNIAPYLMGSGVGGLWYTDAYLDFKVRPDNLAIFNFFNNGATSGTTFLRIDTQDSAGTIESFLVTKPAGTFGVMNQAGVGPLNLGTNINPSEVVVVSGALPIMKSNTVRYSASTYNSLSARTSSYHTFVIDNTCSKYSNVQLVFLDKKGSFVPFNLTKVNRRNINVDRTNYKKSLGYTDAVSGLWNYNTYDRGTTTINNVLDEEITANTDYLNQNESNLFKDLVESPEVYWLTPDGYWVAVVVTVNSYEIKQKINGEMIQYEIKFKPANQNLVQINS